MAGQLPADFTYAVTHEQAAQEVSDLLGSSAWEPACPQCRQLGGEARQIRTTTSGAQAFLAQISTLLKKHPSHDAACSAGSACDYDLYLAQRAAALGIYQLHWTIEWGPGHVPGKHPQAWQECTACTQWVSDRSTARQHLKLCGIDDTQELGDTDTPSWVRPHQDTA